MLLPAHSPDTIDIVKGDQFEPPVMKCFSSFRSSSRKEHGIFFRGSCSLLSGHDSFEGCSITLKKGDGQSTPKLYHLARRGRRL